MSALIPVYNEESTVREILSKLNKLKFITEIVVVNDCSTDGTQKEIDSFRSSKLIKYTMPKNSGKTAAIREAIRLATGDVLVIQDADLEYDPDELEFVLEPIFMGKADVVYGSRFMTKKASRILYFHHYLANKFLTFISNILTNHNMSDIETCYKAMRSPILKLMPITSSGFGMEVEITAMVTNLNLRIYEVPISYYGRTYEEGKKIGYLDGLMAIYYIFYYNLISVFFRKKYFKKVSQELNS